MCVIKQDFMLQADRATQQPPEHLVLNSLSLIVVIVIILLPIIFNVTAVKILKIHNTTKR